MGSVCCGGSSANASASSVELAERSAAGGSAANQGQVSDHDWRWYVYGAENKFRKVKPPSFEQIEEEVKAVTDTAIFACFVPLQILEAIVDGKLAPAKDTTDGQPTTKVMLNNFEAAVVFSDASGFTALTESLAKLDGGAEMLGKAINNFFRPLIELLIMYGGDIIKFSGDALTIVFPLKAGEVLVAAMRDSVLRAAQCCLNIHKKLHNFETNVENVRLSLHIGVGAGAISVLQVGGVLNRWEYVVAGQPLEQIAIAEPLAVSGETVFSPQAWQHIEDVAETGGNPFAAPSEGFKRLISLKRDTVPEMPLPEVVVDKSQLAYLKRYIPQSVWAPLVTGHTDFLDEMRTASVIFMCVSGLDVSQPEGGAMAHSLMQAVQRSVYTQEGSVNKFLVDDKGVLLLAVFGLPPLLHSDDPLRATLAAVRMTDHLQALSLEGSIGVATGRVWCGVVGSEKRQEYTVLSDTVNLSARLMGNAGTNEILIEIPTYEAVKTRLEIKALGTIKVKGKTVPIEIFQPTGRIIPRHSKDQSPLLSWPNWDEATKLRKMLCDKDRSASKALLEVGGALVLTGAQGSGKDQLVVRLQETARAAPYSYCVLKGSNQDEHTPTVFSTPLLAWHQILGQVVDQVRPASTGGPDSQQMLSAVQSLLPKNERMWAPLLADVLPNLPIPRMVVESVQESLGSHAQKKLSELVVKVIEGLSERQPVLVVMHMRTGTSLFANMDRDTWHVGEALATLAMNRRESIMKEGASGSISSSGNSQAGVPLPKRQFPLLVALVCQRTSGKSAPPEAARIHGLAETCRAFMQSQPLQHQESTSRFLAHVLKVDSVPAPLSKYCHELTGGNPGYLINTLDMLQKTHTVEVKNREAVLKKNLNHAPIHPAMTGQVMAHIEGLDPAAHLCLKIAAVFQTADLCAETLLSAYPVDTTVDVVKTQLEVLKNDGFLVASDKGPERYCFACTLFKEVAGHLILKDHKSAVLSSRWKGGLRKASLLPGMAQLPANLGGGLKRLKKMCEEDVDAVGG